MDAIRLPDHVVNPNSHGRRLDGPPLPRVIDRIISLHHGSTTAIEATPQRLQDSKKVATPSLLEKIEQLKNQNGVLNHELAYYRAMEPARTDFRNRVTQATERLQKSLHNLEVIERQVNHDRNNSIGGAEVVQKAMQSHLLGAAEGIEYLQRQNGIINHELAYYREKEQGREDFKDDVVGAWETLRNALCTLGIVQRQVDQEWMQAGVRDQAV